MNENLDGDFEKKDMNDFNNFSAIGSNSVFMNDSKLLKFKGFSANKGGGPSLGIAAPLFVPVERQSRFGDSAIGGEQTIDGWNLNMTRNLLKALQPSKKSNDDFNDNDDDFDDFINAADKEGKKDEHIEEYPTSFLHLVKILLKAEFKDWLFDSNPDGYFYIYFIKTCIKFFTISIATSFVVKWYFYSNPTIEFTVLIFSQLDIFDPKIYEIILGLTIALSFLAYYFLYELCLEMLECEFQPD